MYIEINRGTSSFIFHMWPQYKNSGLSLSLSTIMYMWVHSPFKHLRLLDSSFSPGRMQGQQAQINIKALFRTFCWFLYVPNYRPVSKVSAGFAHNEFRPRSVSPITRMVSPSSVLFKFYWLVKRWDFFCKSENLLISEQVRYFCKSKLFKFYW